MNLYQYFFLILCSNIKAQMQQNTNYKTEPSVVKSIIKQANLSFSLNEDVIQIRKHYNQHPEQLITQRSETQPHVQPTMNSVRIVYLIKPEQMGSELKFFYKNTSTLYRNYLIKRPELVAIVQGKNQNQTKKLNDKQRELPQICHFLQCRIPIQYLPLQEYPLIKIKLIQKEEDLFQQLAKLKAKVKILEYEIYQLKKAPNIKSVEQKNRQNQDVQSNQKYRQLQNSIVELKQKVKVLNEKNNQLQSKLQKIGNIQEKIQQNNKNIQQKILKFLQLQKQQQNIPNKQQQPQKNPQNLPTHPNPNFLLPQPQTSPHLSSIKIFPQTEATVNQTKYTIYVFTSNFDFIPSSDVECVVFAIGGGAAGGRGGTKNRGGGGAGLLGVYEGGLKGDQLVRIEIGEGGVVSDNVDICYIDQDKSNGKRTSFGNILKAEGGQTSGIHGVLYGGNGGSGGGAGQGSNRNQGGKGGQGGNSGSDTHNDWKGGKGLSQQNFNKALTFGLKIGKGGRGAIGNTNGHEAGGGGGGLVIPSNYFKGNTPSGGRGIGLFPGQGGEGFGAGGGGGSYDNLSYNYGGNGAPGCIVMFVRIL